MIDIPKYLFLDLDETLVNSMYATSKEHAENSARIDDSEDYEAKSYELSDGWYVTHLRPGVREFLKWCREYVGIDNVRILTAASKDYAVRINELFELGFNPEHIYDRSYIKKSYYYKFPKMGSYVLVDDLPYDMQVGKNGKLAFLRNLPINRYVEVEQFIAHCSEISEPSYLKSLQPKIVSAFDMSSNLQY